MARIDKMAVFLKELIQKNHKDVFTTDELTDELISYFSLKNRNTAAKYIELLEVSLRYIEYLPNQKWKIVFCNFDKPTISLNTFAKNEYTEEETQIINTLSRVAREEYIKQQLLKYPDKLEADFFGTDTYIKLNSLYIKSKDKLDIYKITNTVRV